MVQLLTSMPQSTIHQMEKRLASRLTDMVMGSESIEANGPQEVVVRDLLPADDLDPGGENAWTTADEEWRQDWNASGTADGYNESYEIDSSGNADDKIIAFYKVMLPSQTLATRQIRFGVGTSGTQGTKAWVNVEEAEHDDEGAGVFSDAIVYGPSQNGNIEHWLDTTPDGQRLMFGALVGEAVGETLSNPSNPKLG